MLSVKQGGIKCLFFLVFVMTRLEIEAWSPEPLANTLSVLENSIDHTIH